MAILTHKLLITNETQNRKVIGLYDTEDQALAAKSRYEACFPNGSFEVVENH